jgi:hypothetical protein
MIDMLVTGDRRRLDAAFELVIADTARRAAGWSPEAVTPAAVEAGRPELSVRTVAA